jgi:hypothetical protein
LMAVFAITNAVLTGVNWVFSAAESAAPAPAAVVVVLVVVLGVVAAPVAGVEASGLVVDSVVVVVVLVSAAFLPQLVIVNAALRVKIVKKLVALIVVC